MTNYYTVKALSQSGIKKYINDGAHRFWAHSVFNPNAILEKKTEAMDYGNLVDTLLFTPEAIAETYAIKDKVDGRTKEGKAYNEAFTAANEGKIVIDRQDYDSAAAMVAALKANPDFNEATCGMQLIQEEFLWEIEGLPVKARMDLIVKKSNGEYIIFDYKTCQNCDEKHFGKDIIKYGYHIQDAFYKEAFEVKYGVKPRFVFIAQEKDYIDAVALWEVQPCDTAIGQRAITRAVKEIATRLKTGNWKPNQGGIQSMNLPTWFYTQQQEEETNAV